MKDRRGTVMVPIDAELLKEVEWRYRAVHGRDAPIRAEVAWALGGAAHQDVAAPEACRDCCGGFCAMCMHSTLDILGEDA